MRHRGVPCADRRRIAPWRAPPTVGRGRDKAGVRSSRGGFGGGRSEPLRGCAGSVRGVTLKAEQGYPVNPQRVETSPVETALQPAPVITKADRHLDVLAAIEIGGRHFQGSQHLAAIGNAGVESRHRFILRLPHELDTVERDVRAGTGFQVWAVARGSGLIGTRHQFPCLAALGARVVHQVAGVVACLLSLPCLHRCVRALWQALEREGLANDNIRQAGDIGSAPAGCAGEDNKAKQEGEVRKIMDVMLLQDARIHKRVEALFLVRTGFYSLLYLIFPHRDKFYSLSLRLSSSLPDFAFPFRDPQFGWFSGARTTVSASDLPSNFVFR